MRLDIPGKLLLLGLAMLAPFGGSPPPRPAPPAPPRPAGGGAR